MTPRRRYVCPECGEDFGFAEGIYAAHMETGHGRQVTGYRCGICGVDFMSAEGLAMHQFSHTDAEVEAAQRPPADPD
jgi:DNA-directed RNA polymerase subunit RPC12/RpoP